jgi:tetratricopeptide (TPR) repeat protein
MIRFRSIAVAICLGMGLSTVAMLDAPVAYAQAQGKPKVSKAVGEPLKAAQAAVAKKQFDVALAEIKKAQAVEKKTPAEEYQIDEFLAYVYGQQKDFPKAAAVYERMLNSGQMPAETIDEKTKLISQLYFQGKEYKKAVEWTKRWLEKHPGQEEMTAQLAYAYFLTDDFKNSGAVIGPLINSIEKNGRTPKEDYVKLLLSANFKQDDKDGIADSLKKMVRYYPKPEYWENLLDIYRRKNTSERVTLGYYRLMNDVGILKEKGDYMEMAQLGLEAGVPGESQQVVESGMSSGILKSADKTEQGRYDRLLAAAKKQATADRASLPQLQKDAEKAKTGQAEVGLGQAYMSYGQFDEAIAAIERGIKKGSLTDVDEAQVSLGIAYLRKGQKEQARQAFKTVKPDSKWGDLAELWSLRSQTNV